MLLSDPERQLTKYEYRWLDALLTKANGDGFELLAFGYNGKIG
jgi:hypothetical protein